MWGLGGMRCGRGLYLVSVGHFEIASIGVGGSCRLEGRKGREWMWVLDGMRCGRGLYLISVAHFGIGSIGEGGSWGFEGGLGMDVGFGWVVAMDLFGMDKIWMVVGGVEWGCVGRLR